MGHQAWPGTSTSTCRAILQALFEILLRSISFHYEPRGGGETWDQGKGHFSSAASSPFTCSAALGRLDYICQNSEVPSFVCQEQHVGRGSSPLPAAALSPSFGWLNSVTWPIFLCIIEVSWDLDHLSCFRTSTARWRTKW